MIRTLLVVLVSFVTSIGQLAAQEMLDGTWRLVSSKFTNTATGAVVDTFGPDPVGYSMYGRDGRVMVLIVRGGRPRPESVDKITDEQRNRLFSSMISYAGTYKFDGKTMEHRPDASWNEVWNGTTQMRDVKREGDRLIGVTKPGPNPLDGSMGFGTVIWEKIK